MVKVRRPEESDVALIAADARHEDAEELWVSLRMTVAEAVVLGVRQSDMCWVLEADGRPLMVAGVVPVGGGLGIAWAIGTRSLGRHKKALLMLAPLYLRLAWNRYDRLMNWVYANNRQAVRFLRWLGADLGEPTAYGAEGLPFHQFHFVRG